jgi:predicted permease
LGPARPRDRKDAAGRLAREARMKLLNYIRSHVKGLLRRDAVIQDIDKELRVHIEMEAEALIERGLKPEAARAAALRNFGNVGSIKDLAFGIRGGGLLDTLWQDARFGMRMLIKRPGFTAVAILTLGLGIGANTAIFSVVEAVLLRPLPYHDPDRLVLLKQSSVKGSLATATISQFDFGTLRDQNHAFSQIAAYANTGFNMTGRGNAERLAGATVTGDLFAVLGVAPVVGRTFRAEEDSPGRNQVCILSYGLWQRDFGGQPEVIGTTLVLNDLPTEVVGIMPQGFSFPSATEVWTPLGLNPQKRTPSFLTPIARLQSDKLPAAAAAESTTLLMNAAPREGGSLSEPADLKVTVSQLSEQITGDIRKPLWVLVIAVGLVLLIACANVANLYLVRANARAREIAVRVALGATSSRVVRQLLIESLLLASAGAVAGLALATATLQFLTRLPLSGIPRIHEATLSGRMLLFTAALGIFSGIVFGLAPALRAKKLGLAAGLRETARGSANATSSRLNNALLIAQLTLSVILLVAAGLLLKSFQRLSAVDPGFSARDVLTARLSLPRQKYASSAQVSAFYERLLERVGELPGIKAAAINSNPPFTGIDRLENFVVEGQEPSLDNAIPSARARFVSPGLFSALDMPLSHGRDFSSGDREDSPQVVIVDQTLARQYWPQGDALGKRIRIVQGPTPDEWRIIVGVVPGVKHFSLTETNEPYIYLPQTQLPQNSTYLVVQTTTEPTGIVSSIRSEIRDLDPNLPLHLVRPLSILIDQTLDPRKLTDFLLMTFALLAVALAAVGIYGVMSLYVNNRTKEFGIRLAIGAQPGALLRYVMRQALSLVMAGVVLGSIGSVVFARLISGMLFEVRSTDPMVFLSVSALLVVVALCSCYLPARRAMKVNPVLALRHE